MSIKHDWERYLACMEEIKKRIQIFDEAMGPFRISGISSVPNCELACLQLRKVYELIAFATLSANREKYSRIRASYEKDGDIARITKIIENINPDFLPIAIAEKITLIPDEIVEIIEDPLRKLDRKTLVKRYGQISDILHAQNPYRPLPDYKKWQERLAKWRDEVVDILSLHKAIVDTDRIFYRVTMSAIPNGEIQVAVFELESRGAKK